MDFPRLGALVYLEKFQVEEVGFASPPYVFEFDMVLPRPSIDDAKRHIIVNEITGKETSWTDKPLRERLIFKEIVEGPLSIGLNVYPAEDSFLDSLTDLIPTLGAELADTYLNQFNLRLSTIKQILRTSQEAGIADVKKTLEKTFASGSEEFTPDEQEEATLKIPLIAPGQIKNPQPDPTPEDNRPEDDHQEILKESGDSNGFVELKIQLVDR